MTFLHNLAAQRNITNNNCCC